ncbi:MAG: hypothetical protein IH859_06400 [Chloroflexi bacterium]|nr:hypothetical protein [Chloroflexota bacterium]
MIIAVGEAPDIRSKDINSGVELDIEITILENLKGDAKTEFERIRGDREGFDLSNGQRGNFDNILINLEILLDNKLNASYENTRTALVIGRVTSIWSCNNWKTLPGIREKVRQIIQGKEDYYPMGIWMFCASENSFEEDILNLVTI